MSSCFETLGLKSWADPEEIRLAYRSLVKQCHPDMVTDPAKKQAAQEQMIRLNLAYEEALRVASPHKPAPVMQELTKEESVLLAERQLEQGRPELALRQLLRAESRDAAWYYTQGRILMVMEQYESAHQSFREAVNRDPENNTYRSGALDAALALKKERTLQGKARRLLKNIVRRE